MKARPPLRAMRGILTGVSAIFVAVSCASGEDTTILTSGTFSTATFDGGNVCVDRDCPAGKTTCPGSNLCAVDVTSDFDHCGACDTPCPTVLRDTPWSYACSNGRCVLLCETFHADCNSDSSDGCETPTMRDRANCGGCNVACPDGVTCWKGVCGCPNGLTQCGDECIDLRSDDENCGACGSVCDAPANDNDARWTCGPGVQPPQTTWKCGNSACTIQCKPGRGNCNDDLCDDGCETDLAEDPLNCGACGHACESYQTCHLGKCECPFGMTKCNGQCVDTKTDPNNCGGCGEWCPGPSSAGGKGGPTCQDGTCGYTCFPGFADCDRRIDNGCETNISTSPAHCGSCNTRCDVAAGQPCVGGTCLTKPCEEGPGPR